MNDQNDNKKQYIAVFIALMIIGVMFFGVGTLYQVFAPSSEVVQVASTEETAIQSVDEVNKIEEDNSRPITRTFKIKTMEVTISTEGTGAEAKVGDTVSVHYTGKLTDGTVFDSSIPRGRPFEFRLGEGRVIAGWEEGIKGMKVGEKRTLTIPGSMAYGSQGVPNGQGGYLIPPNATLVFDVEMLAIK